MVSKVLSAIPLGYDCQIIEVETDENRGLPGLQIVGMGNKAIEESKDRVRSAINNSNLSFPKQKVVVNLAPAEIPKDGTHLDLAIALSILVSSKQLSPNEVKDCLFIGELALSGDIRPVRGVISIAEKAKTLGVNTIYVPIDNFSQASLIKKINIIPIKSLRELFLHLKGLSFITPPKNSTTKQICHHLPSDEFITLDDIYGQAQAKRAIVIATAGRHNVLLTGSPGTGKTMLAKSITGLLPPLSDAEIVSVTKLNSLAGENSDTVVNKRPFRSPHHSASKIAIIGGGSNPRPGEISLSHLGVLFLDEMPEYPRSVLEALRQPLEDKSITIDRLGYRTTYPADFMLVATMNPCPCGYFGDSKKTCTCTTNQILNYQKKISGPLLDRIDLVVNVERIDNNKMLSTRQTDQEQKQALRQINIARAAQKRRYNRSNFYNSNLTNRSIKSKLQLPEESKALLANIATSLDLSPRVYFKIIKVAQTIADIAQSDTILPEHIAEAAQYRQHVDNKL